MEKKGDRSRFGLAALVTVVTVLAACTKLVPTATPLPPFTATLQPTATPTLTPTPTPTPQPTFTATPPSALSGLPAPVSSLAVDPHDRRAAYALLVTNALYRTTDRGQTWQPLALPAAVRPFEPPPDPAYRNAVFLVPQQDVRITWVAPGRIFVRADQTLYRSDDRGTTWQTIQDSVAAWTLEESEGNWLYAWRVDYSDRDRNGLHSSSDGGETWRQVYSGFFPPLFKEEPFAPNHEGMTTLLADLAMPQTLYAGTDFGLFRSLDRGRTWQDFNDGLPPTQRAYRWVPILFAAQSGDIYALTESSPDGHTQTAILARLHPGSVRPDEDTWTVIGQETLTSYLSTGFRDLYTLVADPAQPNRVYLGTAQGLLISEDRGETWQTFALPQAGAVYRIAAAPGEQTQLYLWTSEGLATTLLPPALPPSVQEPIPNQVTLEIVGQIGGQSLVIAVEGDTAYLGVGPRLHVLDVSDPSAPRKVGQSEVLPGLVQGVAVANSLAYVAAGDAGLRILDTSDPASLRQVGFLSTLKDAQSVTVQGSLAYVTEGHWREGGSEGGLSVIDVSHPVTPVQVGYLEMPNFAYSVALAGGHAYVAHGKGLQVVDVSDPAHLREVSTVALPNGASDVAIANGHAYVTGDGLRVMDISHPAQLREVGRYETVLSTDAVTVVDRYVYLAEVFCEFDLCGSTLWVVDVSEPANPRRVGDWGTGATVADIVVTGGLAYLVTWQNGLSVVDMTDPSQPRAIGSFNTLGGVQDVAVSKEYAYVTDSGEGGLHVLDVTQPADPRQHGALCPLRWATDLSLSEGYIYAPVWVDGFSVVNVTDPAHPGQVGSLSSSDLQGGGDRTALACGYAYVTVGDGLRVLDVTDPTSPHLVGQLDVQGKTLGLTVTKNHAYLAGGYYEEATSKGILRVIDVADPTRPGEIGSVQMDGEAQDVVLTNDYAYVMVADCAYAACSGGLRTIDVSDPTHPHLVGSLNLAGGGLDVTAVGSYVYVAAGETGLWVVDVSDPGAPHVAGFLNTAGRARKIAVANELAYVADGTGGLLILRVSQ